MNQLCTFQLNGMLFGLPVEHVQEVIRFQHMTPVPLAPAVVSGLINLRGHIVTAIDLRARLALPPAEIEPTNVVVRHAEGIISLLVDEVGDVVEVDEASFEPPPPNLSPRMKTLVSGVYKLSSRLLLRLDTDRAVQTKEERS